MSNATVLDTNRHKKASKARRRGDNIHSISNNQMMPSLFIGYLYKHARLDAENTGECRMLVKDGRWVVPVEQRPRGWESWGVRES